MHSGPEITGRGGTQAATVTVATSYPSGRLQPSAARHSSVKATASRMLASASSRERPCEMQPGISGHSATMNPSSPGRRITGSSRTGSLYVEDQVPLLPPPPRHVDHEVPQYPSRI